MGVVDIADFRVAVPFRCFAQRKGAHRPCGARAAWQRSLGQTTDRTPFFCDRHRQPGDTPIALDALVRRVRITAEVVLTGTSFLRTPAGLEALDALRTAVAAAGGVLNLLDVTSQLGRYRGPALVRPGAGERGHP